MSALENVVGKINIDFMKWRKVAAISSIILVVVSILSLAFKQLSFGLDFTGGSLVELEFENPAELGKIRSILKDGGIEKAVVQHFGRTNEVVIRVPPENVESLIPAEGENAGDAEAGQGGLDTQGKRIYRVLKGEFPDVELKRNEFVGPQIGTELRDQGGIAMLAALGCMLLYVGFRFRFKFAFGAVAALFHDVLIVLGFFSIFSLPFDQSVLAAILAVIGYSLNDTIVVSDRIRENFKSDMQGSPEQLINTSLTQTLSRTLITSLTTFLVLLALFFLGGETIRYFSVALMVGVIVGTYSSIYVASNLLDALNLTKEDFAEVEPDPVDDMP